jgi:RNA polymerase sigma-70 factor (ECF subfamily)
VQRAMQQVEASVERRTWQAFWRTVVDGQPTESIARELEISTASVRQARSRILRKIREQLGDC